MISMSVGISVYDMTMSDVRQLAMAADEAGFDAVWLGEHVVLPVDYASEHPTAGGSGHEHITGPIVHPDTELLDPWVALGVLAEATTRLRLATGIYILPLRHPLITARSAATLQAASGDRLMLGIGAGWLVEEFAALDVPFDERYGRLVETIEILHAAWAGGPFDYHGKYFSFERIQLTSRPVQVPRDHGWQHAEGPHARRLAGRRLVQLRHPELRRGPSPAATRCSNCALATGSTRRTAATSGWRAPTRHWSSGITPRASTTSSSGPTSCGRPMVRSRTSERRWHSGPRPSDFGSDLRFSAGFQWVDLEAPRGELPGQRRPRQPVEAPDQRAAHPDRHLVAATSRQEAPKGRRRLAPGSAGEMSNELGRIDCSPRRRTRPRSERTVASRAAWTLAQRASGPVLEPHADDPHKPRSA